MMSPIWHDKVMKSLNDKNPNSTVNEVYGKLFTDLPRPTSSMKKTLKQLNSKFKNRVEKRELKPVILEREHLQKYTLQILNPNNHTSFFANQSCQKRNKTSEVQNIFQKNLIDSDASALAISLKSSHIDKTLHRLQPEKIAVEAPKLKKVADFEKDLERQLKEKKSIVAYSLTLRKNYHPQKKDQ